MRDAFKGTEEKLFKCQMITPAGKLVRLHVLPRDWVSDGYMYFTDSRRTLYRKALYGLDIFLCAHFGKVSHKVGKIDVQDLWEHLGNSPMKRKMNF